MFLWVYYYFYYFYYYCYYYYYYCYYYYYYYYYHYYYYYFICISDYCMDDFYGGGWALVRRVQQGNTWHPATDDLNGTDVRTKILFLRLVMFSLHNKE